MEVDLDIAVPVLDVESKAEGRSCHDSPSLVRVEEMLKPGPAAGLIWVVDFGPD